MRVVITGSIALDHLMTFPGRFAEHLIADHLNEVSLSFLADGLTVRRGGTGANIALGLARLGHRPVLAGAAGPDFADYRADLESEGVDNAFVRISSEQYTARFVCTTDAVGNQIATFYPGAMSEAREVYLRPVADRLGGVDLVLIAPDDPDAMLRHTDECRRYGYPFAADPSQQLARMDGPAIRQLVDGARYLFTNAYERELLCQKTGWSEQDVLGRVGQWITTRGRDGVSIEGSDRQRITVPAVLTEKEVDPTGVGDGFRAGFVCGTAWGLGPERAAEIGCALATLVLEVTGPQGYRLDPDRFATMLASGYGADSADEIGPLLRAAVREAGAVR